jgi:hypothetical protein
MGRWHGVMIDGCRLRISIGRLDGLQVEDELRYDRRRTRCLAPWLEGRNSLTGSREVSRAILTAILPMATAEEKLDALGRRGQPCGFVKSCLKSEEVQSIGAL